jgi:WhiB family redox-sensing transcriptional regulator
MGGLVGTRALPALEPLLGPALPGAACAGRAPRFDDAIDGETPKQRRARLVSAAEVCEPCPVRARCNRIADAIPAAVGVWAGSLYPIRAKRTRR